MIAAAASSGFKAPNALREALSAKNVQLLDKSKLVKITDEDGQEEYRITELTSLMIACMMGNESTARVLVEQARKIYEHSLEDFRLFINVKSDNKLGGNNALLYACQNGDSQDGDGNYMLVKFLIEEAEADLSMFNDSN